jgi:hypothetical protein
MTRTLVESSNVAEVGYDPNTFRLEVKFKPDRSGRSAVWSYVPVMHAEYEAMTAPGSSVGRTLALLKKNPAITQTLVAEVRDGIEIPQ